MISVNGYKAFHGIMRIHPKSKCVPVVDKKGDWLYKPKSDAWYCDDVSYPAKMCVVVSDETEKLTPKKPIEVKNIGFSVSLAKNEVIYFYEGLCPACKADNTNKRIKENVTYCEKCGQALDWSAI